MQSLINNPGNRKVITYAAVGVGALLGTWLIASKIEEIQRTNLENQGLNANSPASFAKRLKMAFDNDGPFGWGTDEEAIYTIFRQLPSRAFYAQVVSAYKTLYSNDLNAVLQDELRTTEFNKVVAIYQSRPLK